MVNALNSEMLCRVLAASHEKTAFVELKDKNNILIIGVNIKTRFMSIYYDLRKVNSHAHIYVVAQPELKKEIVEELDKNCSIVDWSGGYTLALFDYVYNDLNIKHLDCFCYFGFEAIDLRNVNILQLAKKFAEQMQTETYMFDLFGDLEKYKDINISYYGLKLYLALDAYCENIGGSE